MNDDRNLALFCDFENIALSIAMARGSHARFVGAAGAQTDYLVELLQIWESML